MPTKISIDEEARILFDHEWYCMAYLGKRRSFSYAMSHFLSEGVAKRHNPHPLFSLDFYFSRLPVPERTVENPLLHYISHGAIKGVSPFPLFTPDWYAGQYDTWASGLSPLAHYIAIGEPEGYRPNEFFDPQFYAAAQGDKIRPYRHALLHYLHTAMAETQDPAGPPDPGPDFSTADYLAFYPWLRQHGLNPLAHYLWIGRKERRKIKRSVVDYGNFRRIAGPARALDGPDATGGETGRAGEIVVATSITGNYSRLLPPMAVNPGFRYVCFSDAPADGHGIWEVAPLPFENPDLTRLSRFPKLNPHILFPKARWFIWVDANIIINADLAKYIRIVQDSGAPAGFIPHPDRSCLYLEAIVCDTTGKDSKESLGRQANHYLAAGHPQNAGLYENNFFVADLGHPESGKLFAAWWEEYMKFSRRDQLSLPFVLNSLGIKPARLLEGGQCARTSEDFIYLLHGETFGVSVPQGLALK